MSESCTNCLSANCDLMEIQSIFLQDQRLRLPFILTPSLPPNDFQVTPTPYSPQLNTRAPGFQKYLHTP